MRKQNRDVEMFPKQNKNKTNMKITKQVCQKLEFHCDHKPIQNKTQNKHGDDTTNKNITKTMENGKIPKRGSRSPSF